MAKRRKKALIITLSVVVFLLLSYFGGGYVAGLIVLENVFGHRYDHGDGWEFEEHVIKMRGDYPGLGDREEVSFVSNGNRLRGHIYFAPSPKGTILFAHGIYGNRDDNSASLQEYFLKRNYSIFAFDMTASSTSEGKGIPGLHQSRFDVLAALQYLSTRNDIDKDKVALLGYSWGAYGVASALASSSMPIVPKAVISMSAFNVPMEEMMFMAKKGAGEILEATRPQLQWAMASRGGGEWNLPSIKGMETHPECNYFLVQGDEDDTVPYKVSLYEAASKSAKRFESMLKRGYGHLGIWRSKAAVDAYKEVKDYFASIEKEPNCYELLDTYVASKGGKETYSQLDGELMGRLETHLETSFAK